ncbi:MAG: M56 family metallopeptidase, partial [Tepidisphaerales bacterium]
MTSLLTHADLWLTHLTRTTLHAGVLAVVVGVLILMLGRRLPAGVRYALWALVLLRLAMPVLPAVRWSPMALLPQASQGRTRDASLPQPSGALKWEVRLGAIELPRAGETVVAATAQPRTPRWPTVLAGVWAGVAAGLMLAAILSYRRLLRRVNCGQRIDDPAILRLIAECAREMRVRAPAIVESALVDGPALVGILRPTIVMPLGLPAQLSPQQWRHVILHELAHLKRHDLWIDWGILVLVCLHWFNPLAWLAAWRFRTEREVLRDAMVLNHGREQEREAYGRTLVELIETLARPAARTGAVGMLAERSDLRRRLTMILSGNRSSIAATILGCVLVVGLVLVAFTRTRDPAPKVAGGDAHIAGGDPRATTAPAIRSAVDDTATRAMQVLLDKRLQELRFDGIALSDVIDFMGDVSGAKIAVNWKAIEAAGIEKTAPVTVRMRDIKFSKALATILSDVGGGNVKLGYTINDGVITISTIDDLNKNTIINVYDIRDLLIDVSKVAQLRDAPAGLKGEPIPYKDELVRDITNLICETVDRESWVANGGKVGQIKFLSGQLIVTATAENQRQIVGLLEKLRESRAIQVSIEMRLVQVRRAVLLDIGLDAEALIGRTESAKLVGKVKGPTSRPGPIIDEIQLKVLLGAVQGDKNSTNLTAPRITVFNGQTGTVRVGTERAYVARYRAGGAGEDKWVPVNETVNDGIDIEIQPTVSADRKYVTVKLHPRVAKFRGMRDEPWDKA